MTNKYAFISVEGGDAVGKTTVVNIIKDVFEHNGLNHRVSTGHAHGEFGQLVRETILDDLTAGVSHTTQLLLFMANRRHIYENIVLPIIKDGGACVVDRWHLTSAAYQHEAENLIDICYKTAPIPPTLNIVLIADQRTSIERRNARNERTDHIERRAIADQVQLNHRFIDGANSGRYGVDSVIVDSTVDLGTLEDRINTIVIEHLYAQGILNGRSSAGAVNSEYESTPCKNCGNCSR